MLQSAWIRGPRVTTQPHRQTFTADEFIAWAIEQPRGRYELVAGEIVAMAPERIDTPTGAPARLAGNRRPRPQPQRRITKVPIR